MSLHRPLQIILVLLLITLVPGFFSPEALSPRAAAAVERPFILPFAEPAGPTTWLLGQTYGNTVGAFRNRREFYEAGQGLHFGVDFSARCGTPIVSIGDGMVSKVDALEHGSAPHNLMIDHPNGFASFYGHLLERPPVAVGQPVRAGEVVAKSGDPDSTCTSRPHLFQKVDRPGKSPDLVRTGFDARRVQHTVNAGADCPACRDSRSCSQYTGAIPNPNQPRPCSRCSHAYTRPICESGYCPDPKCGSPRSGFLPAHQWRLLCPAILVARQPESAFPRSS